MESSQRQRTASATLALLAVAFVAAVMASNTLLSGLRIDLTENRLYTLSPGTEAFLQGLEEPINLYFFFSDDAAGDIQFLRGYATRVREMLEEFSAVAGGRLNLRVIDPPPFSEEEDRAAQFGLQNINLGTLGDSLYFGLAATNAVGDEAIIEVFDPTEEASLEYDLAGLIYSLANPDKPVVGLLSGVSMSGGFDPQTQQPTPPWFTNQQAQQLFDMRNLPASIAAVDDEIGTLWVVHPTDLDDQTVYAIDQFILGGGRALIFVDPVAEAATAPPDPTGLGFGGASGSSLPSLFAAWGVRFSADQVVADNFNALSVNTEFGARPVRHVGLLGLTGDSIDSDDVVSAGLGSVNLGTAGHFTLAEDASVSLVPLLRSSTESALLEAGRFQFLPDPGELLDDFSATGESFILAARLEGPLTTAFPDGPPPADVDPDEPLGAAADPDGPLPADADPETSPSADADPAGSPPADTDPPNLVEPPEGDHLTSIERGNVILVGDVDILSDRLWIQRQRSVFGQQLATAFANNGDFVTNALANLSGSTDLIGLKSRQTYSRPFDTVEALQREADARFRETEQQLQAELAETERRLVELQSARDDTSSLLMSPEQEAELRRFQDEQLRIRQELRTVQRNLDSSIERLGITLKVINIGAVPLALTVLALLVVWLKRTRRRTPA
ncbi:Gldg family protein [Candidatus Rariloculus sp.]|uniref:Gldg family protein n=1 Tax=Candidatus Rariloculus sp. TaxID=3101265 RepID=UPI003D12020F